MVLVPKLPLSITASAEKISAPDTGGLLTHRGWPRRADGSCVTTRWGLGVGRSSIEAPGPATRLRGLVRPGSHYRGPTYLRRPRGATLWGGAALVNSVGAAQTSSSRASGWWNENGSGPRRSPLPCHVSGGGPASRSTRGSG